MVSLFATSLQFAMSRTYINSVAGSYSPEFIDRALQTDYWQPDYALGLAEYINHPNHRYVMLATILESDKLDRISRQSAENTVVSILRTFADEQVVSGSVGIRIEEITPHIQTEQALHTLFAIARKLHFKTEQARALSTVLPRLSEDIRNKEIEEQLSKLSRTGDGHDKLSSIAHLAPVLNTDEAHKALEIVIGSPHSMDYFSALESLASSVGADDCARILELSRDVTNEEYRARLLANLMQNQQCNILIEVLDESENLTKPENRIIVWASAISRLDDKKEVLMLAEKALSESELVENPYIRAQLLQWTIFNEIPDEHLRYKLDALEASHKVAMTIRPDLRVHVQSRTAYLLSQIGLSDELLERTLKATTENHGNYTADALANLMPHLSPTHQEYATSVLQDIVPQLIDEPQAERDECIKWMSGLLHSSSISTEAQKGIISDAFHIIENISNVPVRYKALNYLLPHLQEAQLHKAEIILTKVDDSPSFSIALGRIAQYAESDIQNSVIRYILTFCTSDAVSDRDKALAIARIASLLRASALSETLEIILDFESEISQSGALAILAQESDSVSIDKLFSIAKSFNNESAQSQLLSFLASKLNDSDVATCLRLALQMNLSHHTLDVLSSLQSRMSDDQITNTLNILKQRYDLLEYVQVVGALLDKGSTSESDRDLINKAVELVNKAEIQTNNAGSLVLAVVSIIEIIEPETKLQLLDAALEATMSMSNNMMMIPGNSVPQADALIKIAPYLTGNQVKQAIRASEKLITTSGLLFGSPTISPKFRVLAALASQMNHEQMSRTLDKAFKSNEAWETVHILESLSKHLTPDLVRRTHSEIPNISEAWQCARAWLTMASIEPRPKNVMQRIQENIAKHLREFAIYPREQLLQSIDIELFTPEILGEETVNEIVAVVVEKALSES